MMTLRVRLSAVVVLAVAAVTGAASAGPPLTVSAVGPPALTITGDHNGYVDVHLDAPAELSNGPGITVVRTGAYAGLVFAGDSVLLTSDAMPDVGPREVQFFGGPLRSMRAGTHRVYFFTEPGKTASITVVWDGPPMRLTVQHSVRGVFQAQRVTEPAERRTATFPLSENVGTRGRIWAMGFYTSNQVSDNKIEIHTCITRRTACDRHAISGYNGYSTLGIGAGGVGTSTNKNVRGARGLTWSKSSVTGPTEALDSLVLWTLWLDGWNGPLSVDIETPREPRPGLPGGATVMYEQVSSTVGT